MMVRKRGKAGRHQRETDTAARPLNRSVLFATAIENLICIFRHFLRADVDRDMYTEGVSDRDVCYKSLV